MKSHKSKGDRLNWTPLEDVKSVRLNDKLTQGKRVKLPVTKENSSQKRLLVP